MKKTTYIISIALLSFLLDALTIQAQQNELDTTIVITREIEKEVKDAYKLSERPEIIPSNEQKAEVKYYTISTMVEIPYNLDPIQPAKMKGEPLTKLYKRFFKVGYGTYNTPFAEIYLNNTRSKKIAYGASYKHLSSYGKIKDYGYPGYNDNALNLYGKKFYRYHNLERSIDVNYNTLHQYGFKPSEFPALSNDDTRQYYMLSSIHNELYSRYSRKDKLHHQIALNYYNLFDINHTQENNVRLIADIQKLIKIDENIQNAKINIAIDGEFNAIKSQNTASQNGLIRFTPTLSFKTKDFSLNAGFRAVVEADTTSKIRTPFLIADAKLVIVKDILTLYGGVDGNITKNTFKSIVDQNPFVLSELNYRNTRERVAPYFGLRGNFSKKTSFDIGISNHKYIDMPLFVTDFSQAVPNTFKVLYDTAKVFCIKGEIGYKKSEKLNIGIQGQYRIYQMSNEKEAWHKPKLEINGFAYYNIKDKIITKLNILYLDKSYAKVEDKNGNISSASINSFIDLSLGLEYRYTKVLSAFINFNNIAAQRYYPWYNYPAQRFHLLGGISYAF